MKRFLSILLPLALAVMLCAGCSPSAPQKDDSGKKLSVVSTIFPGYDFTREVAGEHVELAMLLPPGAESHSFEPTPQDIIKIQNCDVFIYVGGDSDTWVAGMLDTMDTSGMEIISLMDLVETVPEEIVEGMEDDHDHEEDVQHDHEDGHEDEHDHEDGHGHEYEYDEHVWTSPVNAMKITEAISDTLCSLDGENGDAYRANCQAYVRKLAELDASFRNLVQDAARKTLIFGDRFPFRYLVDEYGLDYFAAFPGCSTETEASVQTVAFLIDKTRAEKIPAVFHIEFSNEKMADTICEATGAQKLLLHSCHNVSKAQFAAGVSYLELMNQNAAALKEALN